MLMDLFTAFTSQGELDYEGAMIAKIRYQKMGDTSGKETFQNEIVKSNEMMMVLKCTGYQGETPVEAITIYLIMNAEVKAPDALAADVDMGELWYTFSKEEIADFSHTTGDTNSIHLTVHPVVQGLFLLRKVAETYDKDTSYKKIDMKFHYPVYGENPVYIKRDGTKMAAYSDNALCFETSI